VSRGSDLAPLRDSCHLKVSTSRSQTVHKFDVCSFNRSEDISWG